MVFDFSRTKISKRFAHELIQYCSNQIQIQKVVLFGSRARGDFHPDSDIDLAIYTNNATHSQQNMIAFNIQEMSPPLKIDVVFVDRLKKEKMLSNTKHDGVIIYESGKTLREA